MTEMVKDNEPVFTIWAGPYPFLVLTQPKDMEVCNFADNKFVSVVLELKMTFTA